MYSMEPSTIAGIDVVDLNRRVALIEKQRAAEAEAIRLTEAATKQDIQELNSRFNALIKAVWTVAGILATIGGSILANHL